MKSKMKIAITCTDKYYMTRVSLIVTKRYRSQIEIIPISEKDINTAMKDSSFFGYMMDEKVAMNIGMIRIPVLVLSELRENTGRYSIYKYSDVESIYKGIISYIQNIEEDQKRLELEEKQEQERQRELEQRKLVERNMYEQQIDSATQSIRTDKVKEENYPLIKGNYNRVIAFVSLGSGMGSSTAATALAIREINSGKNILHINLKAFSGRYYAKETNQYRYINISDPSKIESIKYIEDISDGGSRDYVIFDIDFSNISFMKRIIQESYRVCFVLDGTAESMFKYQKVKDFFEKENIGIENKTRIIYNKFKNNLNIPKDLETIVAGGLSYRDEDDSIKISNIMAKMPFLDRIIN